MKNETFRYNGSEKPSSRYTKIEPENRYQEEVKASLETELYGQEEMCDVLSGFVVRYDAELSPRNRPAGVVFVLGPTGVGKTESGKVLQNFYKEKGKKCNFKIINCSDFTSEASLTRLMGGSPQWVGYGDDTLINKEFLSTRNVLVFDEIEKADPAFWKMLLAIFDEGKLSVREKIGSVNHTKETVLDFRNSFIILTSNIGGKEVSESNSDRELLNFFGIEYSVSKAAISKMKEFFQSIPEFLGRIDEFVVFKPLKREHFEQIFWKNIREINEESLRYNPALVITEELKNYLVDIATKDSEYGGRDIRHVIDKELMSLVAGIKIQNENIGELIADVENGQIVFYFGGEGWAGIFAPENQEEDDLEEENFAGIFAPENQEEDDHKKRNDKKKW